MKRFLLLAASVSAILLSVSAFATEGTEYDVKGSAADAKVGERSTVHLEIIAKNGAHISDEAPLKIALSAKGAKLEKDKLVRADGGADKEKAQFNVGFVAAAPGTTTIDADMVFFVCTDKLCERQTKKLSIPVNVTAK